jgi:hypothetical protein
MASNRHKAKPKALKQPLEEFPLGTGVLDAVIEIANERNGYLAKMKEPLLSNDDAQLKFYASKLCGIPPESTPSRTPPAKSKGDAKHGKK